MERQRVSSTNLRSVGHDAETATLEVEFRNGYLYRYYDVPASVHAALLRASSKGRYFDQHIRDRFRYRRVR